MLPPLGAATEEELAAEFSAQIESAHEDVDLVLLETMYDLREAVIAFNAARAIVSVPVGCTLTFDRKPKGFFTIMGNEAERSVQIMEEMGVDFVGANCTLTSGDMIECASVIRRATALPVLCQPNAGRPSIENGVPVYAQSPGEFAADIMVMLGQGISAVGGCCGTTPDFIRAVRSLRLRAGSGR
jgi:5-methyltetrahydrofolate--homocysteine methyltransferase